jgi:hypothetical protein
MNLEKRKKLFDAIIGNGFLIGSRAYGGEREASDYDLVISETHYDRIKIFCKENNIQLDIETLWGFSERMDQHNMFNILNDKIRFHEVGEINALVYRDEDIPKITQVHQGMLALTKTPFGEIMAKDKNQRITIFQALKDVAFRQEISERCNCIGLRHNSECPEYCETL